MCKSWDRREAENMQTRRIKKPACTEVCEHYLFLHRASSPSANFIPSPWWLSQNTAASPFLFRACASKVGNWFSRSLSQRFQGVHPWSWKSVRSPARCFRRPAATEHKSAGPTQRPMTRYHRSRPILLREGRRSASARAGGILPS